MTIKQFLTMLPAEQREAFTQVNVAFQEYQKELEADDTHESIEFQMSEAHLIGCLTGLFQTFDEYKED